MRPIRSRRPWPPNQGIACSSATSCSCRSDAHRERGDRRRQSVAPTDSVARCSRSRGVDPQHERTPARRLQARTLIPPLRPQRAAHHGHAERRRRDGMGDGVRALARRPGDVLRGAGTRLVVDPGLQADEYPLDSEIGDLASSAPILIQGSAAPDRLPGALHHRLPDRGARVALDDPGGACRERARWSASTLH